MHLLNVVVLSNAMCEIDNLSYLTSSGHELDKTIWLYDVLLVPVIGNSCRSFGFLAHWFLCNVRGGVSIYRVPPN